jgi:glutamine synthetase
MDQMFAGSPPAMTPADVGSMRAWVQEQGFVRVDLKIGDLTGRLRHVSLPVRGLDRALADGIGFAGSHYGFRGAIGEDMVMLPDPATAWSDPFLGVPSVSFLAQPVRAATSERFARDPRGVAQRATAHLAETAIATDSRWQPELEFFLLPQGPMALAADRRGLGHASSDGYHASPPRDRHTGFRARAVELLESANIGVKYDHHETGSEGQMEIELLPSGLVEAADAVLLAKYIVRNLADQEGVRAVFLPKPMADSAGNGMHVHMHLFHGEKAVFAGEGYGGMSELGLAFLGGVLDHIRALAGLTNPSTNSYRRFVPGQEAPIQVGFAVGSRTSAVRIPGYAVAAHERRFEYRPLDATANAYLAFAGLLMAGLDGVKRGLDPVGLGFGPVDREGASGAAFSFPRNLDEALDALAEDRAFLLEGGVFTEELLDEWTGLKQRESNALALQPHPAEFDLYEDL